MCSSRQKTTGKLAVVQILSKQLAACQGNDTPPWLSKALSRLEQGMRGVDDQTDELPSRLSGLGPADLEDGESLAQIVCEDIQVQVDCLMELLSALEQADDQLELFVSRSSDPQAVIARPPTVITPSTGWSAADDDRLVQLRAQGMNWGPISTNFPAKTANVCRKRHERLKEKKSGDSWDDIKIEDLGRAYLECREAMWRVLADSIGEKWQTVEAKVSLFKYAS